MTIDISMAIEGIAGAVTAVGGLYTAYRHVRNAQAIQKERYRQVILDQAKAELNKVRKDLEDKIKEVEIRLENQRESVSKDLSHLKEVYNAEIKVLGEKIDNLRTDLSDQHSSMVALLTKLVNSR